MQNELYHYGVPGMKWGVRRAREHAGPGRYVTRKRQLAGDKRDLRTLEKGGHLSVGLTKKRQAALDKRDKAAVEKRIAKNENATSGGGIAGSIRRKQRSNAERDLADIKSKQRQVNSELRELKGYDRNPQGLAKSKISTAIRRSQIKSLNKINEKLKRLEKENIDTLKELDSIEKHQAEKRAAKAEQKIAKVKIKDLERQYGELEDQMTYGKNANAKNNSRIESEMAGIESEINKLKNNR